MKVKCHEVGGNVLTICVLSGPRASSILVRGSANLLFFHTTLSIILNLPCIYCFSTYSIEVFISELSDFREQSFFSLNGIAF